MYISGLRRKYYVLIVWRMQSAWENTGAHAYVCVEAYQHNAKRRITQAFS